jgi:filamentous hemagglutinin family protein
MVDFGQGYREDTTMKLSAINFLGKLLHKNSFLILFLLIFSPQIVHSQSIIPANDGTGTIVNINGNTFNIQGGTFSGDGTNLFHSLQEFGLSKEQIANFIANPNLLNILTRVTGGNPSIVDGLIQVTGGNSNLFIMNPAGLVFGKNASLNLSGSFTATTATGIGFGNNSWFNAFGVNNYQNLNGIPYQFAFDLANPGSIINLGDLAVSEGQSLTLIGGNVVSTGNVVAPGGNIIISAVPGSSKVEISRPGDVISLVIDPPRDTNGNVLPFSPSDLPTLLTEGAAALDTGLVVNEDKTVVINDSGTIIPNESQMTIISGNLDASSATSQGGNIQVLGNLVGIVDNAKVDAFGVTGGGNILIGGDYKGQGNVPNAENTFVGSNVVINADALTNGNAGKVIVWADNTTAFYGTIYGRGGSVLGDGGFAEVSGKNNLIFRGNVDLSSFNGSFGTLLLDPENIVISNDASATIPESVVEAMSGNTNILFEATNNITIGSLADNKLTFQRGIGNITFIADSDKNGAGSFSMNLTDWIIASSSEGLTGRTIKIDANTIKVGNINTRSGVSTLGLPGGSVELTASGDITTANLDVYADSDQDQSPGHIHISNPGNSGNIKITSTTGKIDTSSGGLIANSGEGNPGNIYLETQGDIITSALMSGTVFGDGGRGGTITLISGGTINTNNSSTIPGSLGLTYLPGILSNSGSGSSVGGDINIQAQNNVILGDITSGAANTSGSFTITSQTGSISTGNIITSGGNNSGNVTLTAQGSVITGSITSNGLLGSGSVNLTSTNGGIIDTSAGIINTSSTNGNGGTINLKTDGTINAGAFDSSSTNGTGGAIAFIPNNNTLVDNIILNNNITTGGGSLIFTGAVNLNNTLTLDTTGATTGNITFEKTLDGQHDLTLNAGSNINFNDAVGGINSLNSLTVNNAQTTNISNNITTANGNINLNAPTNLTGNSTFNAGTGTINLNSNLTANNYSLNLTSDDLNIGGNLSGTNTLTIQPLTLTRNIDLGTNTPGTLGLDATEINNITGFTQLILGRSDGTGTITVSNPITFGVPTNILSGTNPIQLNANVTTTGQNLSFGNIVLGADVAISTGTGTGNINFNGTVNGTQNLTVDSGTGDITFAGAVGNNTALQNIDINGQNINLNSTVNTINGGTLTITNTGNLNILNNLNLDGAFTQDGSGDIFLSANITTTEDNITFRGNLTLNNTVNFAVGNATLSFAGLTIGNNPLTLTAGEIDFTGGANSVIGSNSLILQTNDPTQNITLGSTEGTTALDLSSNRSCCAC